jgi:hypothetical protein
VVAEEVEVEASIAAVAAEAVPHLVVARISNLGEAHPAIQPPYKA